MKTEGVKVHLTLDNQIGQQPRPTIRQNLRTMGSILLQAFLIGFILTLLGAPVWGVAAVLILWSTSK